MATKKVGITGKYGPRYGRAIREKIQSVASKPIANCPDCLNHSMIRKAAGIWTCTKCGITRAGKAYKL